MTIRNLDEDLKAHLRVCAAEHGPSMEDEPRDILRAALSAAADTGDGLVEAIRARVQPLGGIDLARPPRQRIRDQPA